MKFLQDIVYVSKLFSCANMAFIKRHEISYEKRLEIVFNTTNGKSYRDIATIVGCSKNAPFALCNKFFKF